MRVYAVYPTPIGSILLEETNGALARLSFAPVPSPDAQKRETPLLREAGEQLAQYFTGARKTFDLPLAPEGTPFQKRVWRALLAVPYGKTQTYKDIAVAVGNPKACRAVGAANRNNPLAIFIPCHRIIGSSGSLTGFAGGLDVKKRLLALEGAL